MVAVSASEMEPDMGGQEMVESKKDTERKSRDRSLPEDEYGKKNTPEESAELFHEKDNNSIANEDTDQDKYLIIFLINNIKHLESIEEETRRELFYNVYNNLGKPWFRTLIGYLLEHKAIMWKTFFQVNPGFQQQDFYKGLTILKPFIKKVKISNSNIITQGNQPKIYMWKWASPEDFHNEQGRYAQILLEEKEAEREYIRLEQQRAVARAYTVDNIKAEIKDYLDSKDTKEANLRQIYPHFKSIFTDINDFKNACTELGREGYKIWL